MEDAFDTTALLDTSYTGDLNRSLVPIPEGEMYARIKEGSVKVRRFTSKAGNLVTMADMVFAIEDQSVKDATQLPEPAIPASIFLDTEPGSNRLLTKEDNPNANIQLGRLKHAVGIKEGKTWSLRSFEGLACYIKVEHEANPDDIEHPRSKVVGFYKDKKENKVKR
jgi:hypothetical protein